METRDMESRLSPQTYPQTWSGPGFGFYLTCVEVNQAGAQSSKEGGTDCMRNDKKMSSKQWSNETDFWPKHRNRNKAPWKSRNFGQNRNLSRYTFSAEIACFGRNTLFQLILAAHFSIKSTAKTGYFGFGRNFGFSRGPCFGFGVSAKNLFCLPTTCNRRIILTLQKIFL